MLQATNIHKTYTNGAFGRLEVLKGIDLKIEQGTFVALVGPSGAGKSTLLHIIGGLDQPSQGAVVFQNQDIYTLGDTKLCRLRSSKIGFVFQFYHLLPDFTVLENVMMAALIRQPEARQTGAFKDRAVTLLTQVGLAERLQHFPSQLSGGEKQRVAIARALMNSPEILFCDEPTGNLDSKAGEEIVSMLKEINQSRQMTVVLVTHNHDLAAKADRVYKLRDGVLQN